MNMNVDEKYFANFRADFRLLVSTDVRLRAKERQKHVRSELSKKVSVQLLTRE
jgi:hypothetical protein